jgi:hypothetical protein
MKNIKYIQEFKKNPLTVNTEDGNFLNKLFHTSGQILPLVPLSIPPR